jgi:hypothetical protein
VVGLVVPPRDGDCRPTPQLQPAKEPCYEAADLR